VCHGVSLLHALPGIKLPERLALPLAYEVVGFVEAKVVVLKASAGYGLDEIAATVPVVVTEQTPF
jgi:hypothetical protein